MAVPLVIGLTGSFGSGCSTVASILVQRFQFHRFALSARIREEWARKNPDQPPTREDLQQLGNDLRQKQGVDYLARMVFRAISKEKAERLVVDGFRNRNEVDSFRARYPTFTLVAVLCSQEERWRRLRDQYVDQRLDEQKFLQDDRRDQIQEVEYGQQVALCVDEADLVLNNEDHQETELAAQSALVERLEMYVGLLVGETPVAPTTNEIAMTIAYAQGRRSFCLKRHVGAVIADADGNIIGTGFNENPVTMDPCYTEFGYCYKESMMSGQLSGEQCPNEECRITLPELQEPFKCPSCGFNLKLYFFPDKGMRWCTALHAEERALLNSRGRDLKGATLYTTTFPCFNCARQIAQAGIDRVIYVEPYPQLDVRPYLTRNGIDVVPFEGVKARAFERLFSSFRPYMEKKYSLGGG